MSTFDRSQSLYSLPVAFGDAARAAHRARVPRLTVACLAAVGAATFGGTGAGSFYALGVAVAAGLLALRALAGEGATTSRDSTPRSSR